jgi:hypothetical protein
MKTAVAKKTVPSIKIPTIPGMPYGGGFIAGQLFIGSDAYLQIISPRIDGEFEDEAWNKSIKRVDGALSYCDGLGNTRAMAKAGSKLAQCILDLRIGGHDDWHLWSRLQSLIAFGELRDVKAFQEGGAQEAIAHQGYWTSTQYAGYDAYAWVQLFYYGFQNFFRKCTKFRARAVRMIKLSHLSIR